MVLTADRILNCTCIRTPLPVAPPLAAAATATAPALVVTLHIYWEPRILILSWENSWMPKYSSAALSYSSTNCRESMVCPSLGASMAMLMATVTVSPTLP